MPKLSTTLDTKLTLSVLSLVLVVVGWLFVRVSHAEQVNAELKDSIEIRLDKLQTSVDKIETNHTYINSSLQLILDRLNLLN